MDMDVYISRNTQMSYTLELWIEMDVYYLEELKILYPIQFGFKEKGLITCMFLYTSITESNSPVNN